MVKTQFSSTIKTFHSDNAMEYQDSDFLSYLRSQGTEPRRSCPDTSQQNGRAERKHHHILDTTRALLISSYCPEHFWGEDVLTVVYTINRVPTPIIGNHSPYGRLYRTAPDYTTLRIFGSAYCVLLQPHEHTKIKPRSRLCCFLGYGIEHKEYRCWDPISKRLLISRHVIFWEHKMFSSLSKFHLPYTSTSPVFIDLSIGLFSNEFDKDTASSSLETIMPAANTEVPVFDDGPTYDLSAELPVKPPSPPSSGRPQRVTKPSVLFCDFIVGYTVFSSYEPSSYREAQSNPLWQQAMTNELQDLDKTHTWDIVDLPPGKTAIGCQWVYKIKTHSDGSIKRYKTHLVAQGFSQEYGIDYEKTFVLLLALFQFAACLLLLQLANGIFIKWMSRMLSSMLPPTFNIPKSQLQCHGESIYGVSNDLLSRCANGGSPLERFISVIEWSISTQRPLQFGIAPYNPILGETHHVSRGNLNVLLEQVSHHPPISALHATNEKDKIETLWCHYAIPKFNGTSVETTVHGTKQLKLLNKSETYVMNTPKLVIKFFPVPGVEWLGNVQIRCEETGLEAELCYKGNSFLGRRGNHRSIKGKIILSSTMKTIYEINGHWDRTVTITDISTGKITVIYNAKDVISGLKTPIVEDAKGVWASESAVVWSEVSRGIMNKSWEKAKEAKTAIEEKERELVRERISKEETWVPKHFKLSHSRENGWECSPNHNWVPPAPIVVPL